MKAKSRFLGIDDAPFRFSDETVPVVGVVVQAPSYIEGVLTTLAEVDGHDATERIASMVRRSRYRAGLAAILIDGTAVGGFNVIDIDAVRAAVDRPVVTVTRKKPNLGSIETALRRRFDDWQERVAPPRADRANATGPCGRPPRPPASPRGGFPPAPASTASATSAGPYAHGRFVAIASRSVSTSRVSYPTRLSPNTFAPTPALSASWIPCIPAPDVPCVWTFDASVGSRAFR